jgi:transposase-like protein
MEEKGSEPMESVEEVKRKSKEKESRFRKRYRFEIKLRCVKLHLEEGLPISLLSKEVRASTDGIRRWVKAYQERGEVGLQNPVRSSGRWRRLPGPVRKNSRIQATTETHNAIIQGLTLGKKSRISRHQNIP